MQVSFDELMMSSVGIIGLLEYGLACKVLAASFQYLRYRHLWAPLEQHDSVWIDNSGPTIYEIRHGSEFIRVNPDELQSSRFGKAIKARWDRGITEFSSWWMAKEFTLAFVAGVWENALRFSGSERVVSL